MTRREKIILEGDDRASPAIARAESGFRRFDDNLKKMATIGGLFFAGQALLKLGTASIKAAVDAEEAAAAFDTTFGAAAQRAGEYVEGMANKAGMAGYQLQQLMAITGNVVQGIGATETASEALAERMVTLAADVASFSNAEGGAQAVLLALQSAINGEREALKTYGLAVSEAEVNAKAFEMTGKSTVEELTRLDKALATVEVAYGKAGRAVGDLDRTSDSHANTIRRVGAAWEEAKVTIGQSLLPVLDRLLPVLEQAGPAVAGLLVPAFQALGVALTILSPVLQVVTSILSLVPGWALLAGAGIIALAVHFKSLSSLVDTVRLRLMYLGDTARGVSLAMGALGVALLAAGIILQAFASRSQQAKQVAADFTATLDAETGAITANSAAWIKNLLAGAGLLTELTSLGVTAEQVAAAMMGDAAAADQVAAAIDRAGGASNMLAMILGRLWETGDRVVQSQADLAAAADLAARQERGFLGVVGLVTDALAANAPAVEGTTAGTLDAAAAAVEYADATWGMGRRLEQAASAEINAHRNAELAAEDRYTRDQARLTASREAHQAAAAATAEAWEASTRRVDASFGNLPALITAHGGNIQLAVADVLALIRAGISFEQDLAALANLGLEAVATALEDAGPEAATAADYYLANITEAFTLEGELDAAALAGIEATDPDAHPLAKQQAIASYYQMGVDERTAYEEGWNSYGEPIHSAGALTPTGYYTARETHGGWGEVPDRGGGRNVPALLQPGETVLSRQESARFRGGQQQAGTTVNATIQVTVPVAYPVGQADRARIARQIKADLEALTGTEVHEWQLSR